MWIQDLYTLGLRELTVGNQWVTRLMGTLERWVLNRADHIVVIHPRLVDVLSAEFGVARSKVEVIPNWSHISPVHATDEERRSVRAKHGWPTDQFLVLHAGNMGVKQGLGNVAAAGRLAEQADSNVHFVLLGDGSQRSLLAEDAAGCSHLTLTAQVPSSEFPLALASCDVLLINESPGMREMAVPSKLTSYLATGVPVLAAVHEDGITGETVSSSAMGMTVAPGDPKALLDGAISLASSPALANRLAENGLTYWRENLSHDAARKRWLSVLKKPLS